MAEGYWAGFAMGSCAVLALQFVAVAILVGRKYAKTLGVGKKS